MDKNKPVKLIEKVELDSYNDIVLVCPNCKEPFSLPIQIAFSKNRPKVYPCSKCNQLIDLAEK